MRAPYYKTHQRRYNLASASNLTTKYMETKTRTDYLAGLISHEEYYGNIAQALGLEYTRTESPILRELLAQDEIFRDSDHDLNSIELHRWDVMGSNLLRLSNYKKVLADKGETDSQATRVCIVKSAMKLALRKY